MSPNAFARRFYRDANGDVLAVFIERRTGKVQVRSYDDSLCAEGKSPACVELRRIDEPLWLYDYGGYSPLDQGFLYAAQDGNGAIKVGWSADPERRIISLRSGRAKPCEMLGWVPGRFAEEQLVHRVLRPWRIKGEWYRNEGLVTSFVRRIVGVEPRAICG